MTTQELADHIEMEHERDIPMLSSVANLRRMHHQMHELREWNHSHNDNAS